MTPFIQKTLQEFESNFNKTFGFGIWDKGDGVKTYTTDVLEHSKSFFTTSIEQAILKGLELAEGAVDELHERGNAYHDPSDHNATLGLALSRLALLKKEVMEGRK